MRKTNKTKLLQLLSRLWNGSNGVLAGKQAEQKMISILRNRFPQAQLIEVIDVSGKIILSYIYIHTILSRKERFLNNIFHWHIITIILGGCGAMFDINVVAPEFKGLNTVKQHRIINEVKPDAISSQRDYNCIRYIIIS